MQLLNRVSPKTAKRTGIVLFVFSCLTFVAALTLPFVPLPLSGTVKAGLITGIVVAGELAFAASVALLGKEYVNRIKSYVSVPDAPFSLFFLGAGVAVWAVATVLLRFVGQYLLIPGDSTLTIAAFVGVAILMILLMSTLYRMKPVHGSDKLLAATYFALPGLVLDAGTVYFYKDVYPNMQPEAERGPADSLLAAWLFWGYGVVLITGGITLKNPNK